MQQDSNSGYGYNGEPLSRPPSRTAGGAVRRSRTDNSIQFPTQPQAAPRSTQNSGGNTTRYPQQRSGSAQRPRQQARPTGSRPRRPSGSTRNTGNAAPRAQKQSQNRPRNAQNPRNAQTKRNAQSAQQRYQNQRLRPAQPHDPARREVRKKRKVTRATLRRRRLMRRLMAFAMLLCVIGAGIYLTMTMLFRISTIRVETADGTQVTEIAGYSADSILQVLGVQLEQNIFSFEPGAREAVLEQQFPLLESIKVVRDYPSTVVVKVTEATPTYAVQDGKTWLIISDTMKILSTENTLPEGLCTLYGGKLETDTPGEQLRFENGSEIQISSGSEAAASGSAVSQEEQNVSMDVLTTLRSKLEEYGLLADVTRMEFADPEEIAFLYQDRISVLLGTANDLDYKLDRAKYVLTDADGKGCGPTDTGRLDFSHTSAGSNRKIYFAQGEPTLPSGYVVQPKTEDTTTEADSTDTTDATAEDTAAQPADTADELPLTDPARMTATEDENPM